MQECEEVISHGHIENKLMYPHKNPGMELMNAGFQPLEQFSFGSTRELTGYPPMQYLNRLRFERACALLRNTALQITEIGFSCGYATSQYFAETFKRYARMTPTEYRQNLKTYDDIMRSNWSHPEARSIDDEQKRVKGWS